MSNQDVYQSRTNFVVESLNYSKKGQMRKILDAGFIGDHFDLIKAEGAPFHFGLLKSLQENDFVIGLDNSKEKLDLFLQNEKTKEWQQKFNVDYRLGSIFETGLLAGEIDAILLLEVFEHLFNPYAAFNEIKRVLKPGGSFIMTYPNPLALHRHLRYSCQNNVLDKKFLKIFKGAVDHLIFPHPVCLINYLQVLGFKIEKVAFIKFDIKALSWLHYFLAKIGLTKKYSSYIGIHAIKE